MVCGSDQDDNKAECWSGASWFQSSLRNVILLHSFKPTFIDEFDKKDYLALSPGWCLSLCWEYRYEFEPLF